MKKRLIVMLMFVTVFGTIKTYSQIEKYQAAYLYNFFSYINWPSEYRSGDFVIGVLGDNDALVKELEVIASTKKVLSQKITIVTFPSVNAITKCQVLIIPAVQSANVESASSKIGSNSTLLVSSTPTGIAMGAAINFIVEGGKLKFETKVSNAEKQNVKISSSLNQLAAKSY